MSKQDWSERENLRRRPSIESVKKKTEVNNVGSETEREMEQISPRLHFKVWKGGPDIRIPRIYSDAVATTSTEKANN
jgi:hypothetical protein